MLEIVSFATEWFCCSSTALNSGLNKSHHIRKIRPTLKQSQEQRASFYVISDKMFHRGNLQLIQLTDFEN